MKLQSKMLFLLLQPSSLPPTFIGQRNGHTSSFVSVTVQSHTDVIGNLGNSITLEFTFSSHVQVKTDSHIVVHQMVTAVQKVAEYTEDKRSKAFYVHPENNSVSWHITSVTLNDTGSYWASVVSNIASKSNVVRVTIQEVTTTSTGKPRVWPI